jgi:hypothetical protein
MRIRPGARVATKVLWSAPERGGLESAPWFAVQMVTLASGDCYPENEVRVWLAEAGVAHDGPASRPFPGPHPRGEARRVSVELEPEEEVRET